MAMGEGGPELVKQLLNKTYDIRMPGVVAIYLDGEPIKGVGPQDVALAIIGATFANGYVNNKVMEFVGPGVEKLSADFRIGIDVMTTETTCLSSIWKTDEKIKEFYDIHGRVDEYKELNPGAVTYYDGMVYVNLSEIKPMIAMPFHPSNVYTIDEVNANLAALEASYNGASESVKTAVDAKDFSKKLAYYKNYADAVAKTAHAELLGVQLKNESSVEASDLRFVVKYEANTASGYIVSSYGAVVVPNQVRGNNPDLTRKIDVVSGKEDYFVDVNVKSETVTVDGDNRFYVNVTNSKGKPGLLFDCRPYVVYTNGTDEFTVYADNAVADTDVTEGQATKCALFAAKKLSESITSKLGTDVTYPDGFDSTSYPAIIEKINKLEDGDTSLGKTTAEEKKAVFAFVAMNYDAYKA